MCDEIITRKKKKSKGEIAIIIQVHKKVPCAEANFQSRAKICLGWFYFYIRFVFSDSKYVRIA